MTNSEGGVVVTIAATHLDPKAVYVAHVRQDLCSATDPGGPTSPTTPAGGDAPPNELHLAIAVAEDGKGTATSTSSAKAGPDAKSVVIHLTRPAGSRTDQVKPPRVACADLAAA